MKLSVSRSLFTDSLLSPASKLSDNVYLLFEGNNFVKTLVSSLDGAVHLLSKIPCNVSDVRGGCIIPECKTFLRLFAGTSEDTINLEINSNAIEYNGEGISFKYHLLDESYLTNKKSISEEKVNNLSFDTTFSFSKKSFSDIIKHHSILPDAEKLYFFTKNGEVFAKIGDDQKSSTNEITTNISPNFDGDPLIGNLPINIQHVLLMLFVGDKITVKVNHQLNVFKFYTDSVYYIVSGLVK
jgi:hypothetical protein